MWFETFLLGAVAGWISAMVFLPKIGRYLHRKQAERNIAKLKQMSNDPERISKLQLAEALGIPPEVIGELNTVAVVDEITDKDGNVIEPGSPEFEEAVKELKQQVPFPIKVVSKDGKEIDV